MRKRANACDQWITLAQTQYPSVAVFTATALQLQQNTSDQLETPLWLYYTAERRRKTAETIIDEDEELVSLIQQLPEAARVIDNSHQIPGECRRKSPNVCHVRIPDDTGDRWRKKREAERSQSMVSKISANVRPFPCRKDGCRRWSTRRIPFCSWNRQERDVSAFRSN